MKSLQNKLNLIKEGKGNKELFLKEARVMFPSIVTGALTFDQAIHNLSERGIISNTSDNTSVENTSQQQPNWFKIFNENVKADLKKPDAEIEKMETAGYDYKDKKNSNNISTAEMLTGYYAEMKDPKNAEKTETEIKAIVIKNLEKDPLHYVKDGQFGVKGVGYTDKAPGLGATKEVTGKYKSSGMEPVKLNEAVAKSEEAHKYMMQKAKEGAKERKEKEKAEKAGSKGKDKVKEVFYGDSDGDYDADQESRAKAEMYYDKGMQAYSEGDYLKADQYYKLALKNGSWLGWTEQDLPAYGTEHLEEATTDYSEYSDSALTDMIVSLSRSEGNEDLVKQVKDELAKRKSKQGNLKEGYGDSLEDAMKRAYENSLDGYVQHVQSNEDGTFSVSDWYDSDNTVVSFEDGRKFNDNTADFMDDMMQESRLNEAKNKAMEKAVKEIENRSELAKVEAKLTEIENLISELESKLTMTEADGMSDMVDKKKVKEIRSNIKFLEAKKKRYHKEKSKMESRYGTKEKEMIEEEADLDINKQDDIMHAKAYRGLKTGASQPVKPWSEIVKDIMTSKGLKK